MSEIETYKAALNLAGEDVEKAQAEAVAECHAIIDKFEAENEARENTIDKGRDAAAEIGELQKWKHTY